MARTVKAYPAGELQDWAEDRLAALIGQLDLTADELELVRYFRT
ncbi:hypothetical protein [Roseomonas marmotae]|nr:hypothetical protein [Roseomonas marmotae]